MIETTLTLQKLACLLQGTLRGDGNCEITGIASLREAKPGDIAFLDNPLYRKYLKQTQASAVILSSQDASLYAGAAIIVPDPYYAYAKVAELFQYEKTGVKLCIHPSATIGYGTAIYKTASLGAHCVVGDGVKIGEHVVIEPGCVVGDYVVIGDGSHISANVTLSHGVTLGERVMVHSGAVIGSDGFGYVPRKTGWYKVPQLGAVRIGNDVRVGANTSIDRGALQDTVIEQGAILDNQIQVAHNVHIGEYTAIAGCVGISGSAVIGKHCLIGGGAGIAGHVTIGDYVSITAMAMVTKSITVPGVYSSGTGIQQNAVWKRSAVRFHQLDALAKRLQALEKKLANTVMRDKDD